MTNNEKVIKRINSAVSAGVKIKTIAENSEITFFRLASVVNTKSYRTRSRFTDLEVTRINETLDQIKNSL
jgi:uncharacterized protein YqfB (UPF0267 family)